MDTTKGLSSPSVSSEKVQGQAGKSLKVLRIAIFLVQAHACIFFFRWLAQIVVLWSSILGVGNSKLKVFHPSVHHSTPSYPQPALDQPVLIQPRAFPMLNNAKLTFRRGFLQEHSRPADRQIYVYLQRATSIWTFPTDNHHLTRYSPPPLNPATRLQFSVGRKKEWTVGQAILETEYFQLEGTCHNRPSPTWVSLSLLSATLCNRENLFQRDPEALSLSLHGRRGKLK